MIIGVRTCCGTVVKARSISSLKQKSQEIDTSASFVVPKPSPSIRFKGHCNANIYLATFICNSNTAEEVFWQTVSSVGPLILN